MPASPTPPVPPAEDFADLDAYWRACNYLAGAMIYLQDNPLLREPLRLEHIKRRPLGHWGASPALSFVWVHLNRLIRRHDLDALFIAGPGHGAPGVLAPTYLEGTYSEIYPEKSQDAAGLRRFLKDFSFPGGTGSHCTPELPGSIHEGGELGYSLSHACGAAFDNPDLLVAAVIGDGEAETGPLATAWHASKFLNPRRDGAVLPVLNLNGYKINNPTLLARIEPEELAQLLRGYGWTPHVVEGDEPAAMHRQMAATLDACLAEIRAIQRRARQDGDTTRPRWPMIVLRTPKGWTGPREFAGHRVEGSWRAHQLPLPNPHQDATALPALEAWLRSYRPETLFDADGRLLPALRALAPQGTRRLSANPHANGGLLRRPLALPDWRAYAVPVAAPGRDGAENTRPLGRLLRDLMAANPDTFRLFGPDETTSNKLDDVYAVSGKTWLAATRPEDADGGHLDPDGRVMEMLSEHTLEGWLEGYLLSGRHGLLSTYEAFAHVIDSMFNQHAKWLEVCRSLPWRAPVASLNLLITSTVWRQDHNGFTHQDPGFLDLVVNKSPAVVRIYLPPDANCLLAVADHCLRGTDRINVIVADKQKHLQYLDAAAAARHCAAGIGIWPWAGREDGAPDVVVASAGDVPTREALAAVALLREALPALKLRFINVVDLFRLVPAEEHPHGLDDAAFEQLFTADRPVIFNFHGYPWLIHRLTYRRPRQERIHVRGYKEKGNIDTPLELAIRNQIDRFSLAIDIIDRLPQLAEDGQNLRRTLLARQAECRAYAYAHGTDLPAEDEWHWR